MVTYFFMIYLTLNSIGAVTIVYPLSVFGYAMLLENGPGKVYWSFILLYTQIIMVFEFSAALFLNETSIKQL